MIIGNRINDEINSKLVKHEQARVFRIIGMILRVIFGLVFVYSGFVKAVDPLGHTYKMLDYFQAMNLPQIYTPTLILGVLMIALEFTIGIAMILGIQLKFFSWTAFGFMMIMTPITLWLALTNAVSDCGCFGEAIKLTNWATFGKNVVLMIILVLILYFYKYNKPYIAPLPSWLLASSFFVFSVALSVYCLRNLPLIDYLPYKIGNSIPELMEVPDGAELDQYETTFVYRNKIDGVEHTFDDLGKAPWNDTVNWEYVSQDSKLVKKGYEPPIHDLMIEDIDFGDVTDEILSDTNFVFMFVMYNLSRTDIRNLSALNNIYYEMSDKGYNVVGLTASTTDVIDDFSVKHKIPYHFCIVDEIPLKSMVRANPGVIIIKDGIVIDKWNANNSKEKFESFVDKYL